MGFLPGDSNSIIIDAVLTDLGRKFIARNDGSFSVVKFAAGDEEVDYSIIKKFGRTIGSEKIEKNTPIFEALTNPNYGQKYRLISVSNPNLIRLPSLKLEGEGVDSAGGIVAIGNTNIRRRTLTVYQNLIEGTSIDVELRDQSFIVQMDNRFLQVLSAAGPDNIDGEQRATYILPRDAGETSLGGSRVTLQIATKAILESQFQVYGARNNKSVINTYVRVSGIQSGSVKEFAVSITKTA